MNKERKIIGDFIKCLNIGQDYSFYDETIGPWYYRKYNNAKGTITFTFSSSPYSLQHVIYMHGDSVITNKENTIEAFRSVFRNIDLAIKLDERLTNKKLKKKGVKI